MQVGGTRDERTSGAADAGSDVVVELAASVLARDYDVAADRDPAHSQQSAADERLLNVLWLKLGFPEIAGIGRQRNGVDQHSAFTVPNSDVEGPSAILEDARVGLGLGESS